MIEQDISAKLQASFRALERTWAQTTSGSDAARQQSVDRLQAGKTLRFVYHEWSNREPVDRIIFEAGAVGQQDLGLFTEPLIHAWVPGVGKSPTGGIDR